MQIAPVLGLHFAQNRPAALHHQAQLPANAPGQLVYQILPGVHQGGGPGAAVGQQLVHGRGDLGGLQVLAGDAKALAIGLGQVKAAPGQVFAQVLPKVDQLQRGANGIAALQCLRVGDAVQVQQQAPHGVGRAAAVVQQLGAVGITGGAGGFFNVLDEGTEQIIEQRHRQLVAGNGLLQRGEHSAPARAGGVALGAGVQVVAVGAQIGQALGRQGSALIGQIIGGAGKGINCRNWRAQVRGAQPRGNGKILVMGAVRCGQGGRVGHTLCTIMHMGRRQGRIHCRIVA